MRAARAPVMTNERRSAPHCTQSSVCALLTASNSMLMNRAGRGRGATARAGF
jgi:hypothetical protein